MKTYEIIRSLREERDWSQKDMAEKLEMSVNGYAKIERGETSISMVRLEQIATIFNVDIHDLLPTNDSNSVCLVIRGDNNQGSNFYNAEQELLSQKERELTNLYSIIELLKK